MWCFCKLDYVFGLFLFCVRTSENYSGFDHCATMHIYNPIHFFFQKEDYHCIMKGLHIFDNVLY